VTDNLTYCLGTGCNKSTTCRRSVERPEGLERDEPTSGRSMFAGGTPNGLQLAGGGGVDIRRGCAFYLQVNNEQDEL